MVQRSRVLRSLCSGWAMCTTTSAAGHLKAAPASLLANERAVAFSGVRTMFGLSSTSTQQHLPSTHWQQPARQTQQQQQQQAPQLVRLYRCCPGLDGAPPDVISIEFDPEEVDRYIQVADAIEAAFPGIVVEGNETAEGAPGSFEIRASSGELIFSKLSSGRWPQVEQLVTDMQAGATCDLPAAKST